METIINLTNTAHTIVIIRHGAYYGCVKDANKNVIKKGFDIQEDARKWIEDKADYVSRWVED